MEINKIDIGITSIDKIFHVSDIHIRTLKRHSEYREVFNTMFLTIAQEATDNSICVVTGDIVHSKLDMSPELINMLTEFFSGFMIPTIVILGNHDMNLNNTYRVDALSPILNVINNKNIHFIKENGVFEIASILFNHMAVDVPPTKYIKGTDLPADRYSIAMHHGAVHTAKTDIGYEISNEHVTTELFSGHDLCLLGDIHKPNQILQEYRVENGIKKPLTIYPGSTIQQNHGEALDHGILVWDLPSRSAKFVEIHNNYGYVTFELDGTKIVNAPTRVPTRPRVRVKFKDTSAADMKKFIASLKKQYLIEDISIQRVTDMSSNTNVTNITIGNVRDVEYQNTLITDHVENNFPQASNNELDAIRHINRSINSKLPVLDSVRNITWHPVSFEFSNMFSYGENNHIDFTKLSDVVGLFAPNTSGKSSLLDAITYCIFDKCSKTGKAAEVLNNKSSKFFGKFCFEMNNTIYTIERTGIKNKSGHVKVNVEFYSEAENLNGEERSETNKNIRKYLGTYDDFILTAFSLQADNNNFINKSQRERKDLLSQFLDITVFEQLYQLAAEEIKETAGRLKEYKKTDFATIITECDSIINLNSSEIESLELEETTLHTQKTLLQDKIVSLVESKHPTTYTGPNKDLLVKVENELLQKIQSIQDEITKHEITIENTTIIISKTKTKLAEYDSDEINTGWELLRSYTSKVSEIDAKVKNQQGIINVHKEKIQHLTTHEYDPNCNYCTSNVFVKDALESKNKIDEECRILAELLKQREQILAEQSALEHYETLAAEIHSVTSTKKTYEHELERFELRLQILENELQTRESELQSCLEKQDLFQLNESAIKHNETVDNQIKSHKQHIETAESYIKNINSKLKSKHGEIEVAKTKKQQAIESLDKYKQLEIEYVAYEYYLQSIKRDGVPYDIIEKALPKIESEINNVLNQIVDFNMVLNTDGKNINGYIIYDDDNYWPLELTSGMERFISSLAIRVALINVSALPRPNFIAIDEGFGTLDSEHISSLHNMFEYFKYKFDFTIIISHVDSMRDMVDSQLDVNKDSGFSKICNV